MMKLKLDKYRYPGKLIVFEGTDGAGKTTLIEMSRQYLAGCCGTEKILVVKQPTDASRKTKLFQKMMYCKHHEDINYRAVQLLTMSDRIQHNFEVILPALRDGKLVICDRYIFTSEANMIARGYDKEEWFYKASREIAAPDLTMLAYVPAETALNRIRQRPEEARRHLNEGLLTKVAEQFLRMRKAYGIKLIRTDRPARDTFCEVKTYLDQIIR